MNIIQRFLAGKTLFSTSEAFLETLDVLFFSCTLVIKSCEAWREVLCSSLTPCKESRILGICNGKLCNIISVVSEGTACFQMLYSKA